MKHLVVSLVLSAVVLATVGCASSAPASAPATAAAPAQSAPAPTKAAEPAKAAQPAPAAKADFPGGKPITFVVGWAAGGATDIGARLMAAGLEKELKTSVTVVDKPGAGSQVGVTDLVNAKPDGYTIGTTNLPTTNTLYLDAERKAVFTRKSFAPIANYLSSPMVLAVKGNGKYKTLQDVVNEAKARPDKVTIANTGILGVSHLPILALERLANIKVAHIEMTQAPDHATRILGDVLDAGSGTAGNWTGLWRSGDLRYVAVFDTKEDPSFKGVPTAESQGYKVSSVTDMGMAAPAGTPKEIVDILSAAVKKVTESDEFKKKSLDIAMNPNFMDSAQYSKYWDTIDEFAAPLVKQYRDEEKKK